MLGLLKLVLVLFAPLRRELAFKGVLQDRLPIDLELLTGGLQALDALVQFGKKFLDPGNDSRLLSLGRNRYGNGLELGGVNVGDGDTQLLCRRWQPSSQGFREST